MIGQFILVSIGFLTVSAMVILLAILLIRGIMERSPFGIIVGGVGFFVAVGFILAALGI